MRDAHVLVIASGIPRFFAAGADLKLLATLERQGFERYLGELRAVLDTIAALPQPSVAAIDGIALGGGLELALACTLRVAGPAAQLGVPEVRLGLLPGAGGTQRLPRLIGRSRALDLLLTGRSLDSEEALRSGLVDRVAPDAAVAAAALAGELASRPAATLSAIGRCVEASASGDVDAGMLVELHELLDRFESADGREGIRAFIERRPPDFS